MRTMRAFNEQAEIILVTSEKFVWLIEFRHFGWSAMGDYSVKEETGEVEIIAHLTEILPEARARFVLRSV